MIAKIIPGSYDMEGRPTGQPRYRHGFEPTFPMRCYLTQPLTVHCANLEEIRMFLSKCQYVTDKKQFGCIDYWMPPEDFESKRQGDCEDFALWTWRQLLELGYDCRFVVGHGNRNARGHAWLTYHDGNDDFVIEPIWGCTSATFPRFHTLFLRPRMSAEWDGTMLRYYDHEDVRFVPSAGQFISLLSEAIAYWVRFRIKSAPRLAWMLAKLPIICVSHIWKRLKVDSFRSITHNRWRRKYWKRHARK